MPRISRIAYVLLPLVCAATPALADGIDDLRGQFAFNWHRDPDKTPCVAIDDKQLALFKSDAFTCNLEPVTNTASGETARMCTAKAEDGGEYLIFANKKSCDLEREAQAANAE